MLAGFFFEHPAAGATGAAVAAQTGVWIAAITDILLDNLEQLAVGIDASARLPANDAANKLKELGSEFVNQKQDAAEFLAKLDRHTEDFETGLYGPGAAVALGQRVHPPILASLRDALARLGNDERSRAKAARLGRAIT